ncbi:MAG: hypothetical protein IK020_05635 [Clostridiales bacterium]|nr:hypothetical protein [Clostridiales bacterium]
MIKELKVNFYRIIRTKSFIVISILLILGALISSVEIKFCVDDPFGIMDILKQAATESSTTEADRESFDLIFRSLDEFRTVNNLSGVVRMMMCSDITCFLHCIFVALFVSSEYKSRFHVNHFSLNTRPEHIVFMEWLTLMIVIVLMEIVCYGVTLGLSILMCNSFHFDDGMRMLKYSSLALGVIIAFASFSFMIAFLRKAGALAIVLSSLFVFGVFDFVLGIISVWASWAGRFSLNNILSGISVNAITSFDYMIGMGVVLLYVVIFAGIPIIVASKRDPY